jgi:hypothetical protein
MIVEDERNIQDANVVRADVERIEQRYLLVTVRFFELGRWTRWSRVRAFLWQFELTLVARARLPQMSEFCREIQSIGSCRVGETIKKARAISKRGNRTQRAAG